MSKRSKRVFVMNNLNSRYIEQAIFILKDKEHENKINEAVISEAEKIVSRYLVGEEENKKSAAKSGTLYGLIAVGIIAAAAFMAAKIF